MTDRRKFRTEFRKGQQSRRRDGDLTRRAREDEESLDDIEQSQRVSGKGDLTRHRTVVGATASDDDGLGLTLGVDNRQSLAGRVLRVHGLESVVLTDDGRTFRCATRRLLKSLSTDQRHVVAAGDRVFIRPEGTEQGFIERIEPRHGVLSRTSRGRRHVIVANIDQLIIVASAAEPVLKPNLIDRYLATAEQLRIEPIICINKVDLVSPADLQPLAGVYGRMGYEVHLISADKGWGVARIKARLTGRQSVVSGQSGVGKSSLLNAVDPELALRVAAVSEENEKGRHTTTTAQLIPLPFGGFVVDTPGIRQFQLWDVIPEETASLYRDIRPFVAKCRFPDCSHTHEADCAVKDAVADGRIDLRRYESYQHLYRGEES